MKFKTSATGTLRGIVQEVAIKMPLLERTTRNLIDEFHDSYGCVVHKGTPTSIDIIGTTYNKFLLLKRLY
jgi:hypothetical protein